MKLAACILFAVFCGSAQAQPKLPNSLTWICPIPSIWAAQDKAKEQMCAKEERAYNREWNFGHDEASRLEDEFALKWDKWQRRHPQDQSTDSWKKSPELSRLHQRVVKADDHFRKLRDALDACQKQIETKTLFTLNVYSGPSFKSKKLGRIEIDGAFRYWFVDANGDREPFDIDSYDPDGTACQTLWAQNGDWFEMPGPFSQPGGWINIQHEWHVKGKVRPIRDMIVKGFPKEYSSGFWIKDVKDGFIVGRKEMPYDMGGCGPADGHDETPAQEKARRAKEKADADAVPLMHIPVFKAYDSDGHIIPKEKYTRGC